MGSEEPTEELTGESLGAVNLDRSLLIAKHVLVVIEENRILHSPEHPSAMYKGRAVQATSALTGDNAEHIGPIVESLKHDGFIKYTEDPAPGLVLTPEGKTLLDDLMGFL